jgi:hypothetical protein
VNDLTTSTAAIECLEDARWYTVTGSNGRLGTLARFCKGNFAVMINIFKVGETDVDYVKHLASEQYQRLP